MLPSTLTLLAAIISATAAAAAPPAQDAASAQAGIPTAASAAPAAPSTSPGSGGGPSALELGVGLTRIALAGALAAAQQMLALEQALAGAGGSAAANGSAAAIPVSSRIAGSAPSSAPSSAPGEADPAVGEGNKTLLLSQQRDQQVLPVEQQIQAARDTIVLFTTAAANVRTLNMALAPSLGGGSAGSETATILQRALAQQQLAQVARAALLANLTGRVADDASLLRRFVDEVAGAVNATDAMLTLVDGGGSGPG